jgi:hypothetical protein
MKDRMQQLRQAKVDHFAHGRLNLMESRQLAQEALEDPELYEELTGAALARATLDSPEIQEELQRQAASVRPTRGRFWMIAFAMAATLAVVVAVVPMLKPRPSQPKVETGPDLSAMLLPAAKDSGGAVFRSLGGEERAPRRDGKVVAIQGRDVVIDLGSMDGVESGVQLQVYRDAELKQLLGTMTVEQVFRDHARGSFVGVLDRGDHVQVASTAHLNAVMDQLPARGEEAGKAADAAVAAPAAQRASAWNAAGVARFLRGDRAGAEARFRQAGETAESLNNLGALAELRGDRTAAAEFYSRALRVAKAEDRAVVERNLARVR